MVHTVWNYEQRLAYVYQSKKTCDLIFYGDSLILVSKQFTLQDKSERIFKIQN